MNNDELQLTKYQAPSYKLQLFSLSGLIPKVSAENLNQKKPFHYNGRNTLGILSKLPPIAFKLYATCQSDSTAIAVQGCSPFRLFLWETLMR